MECEVSEREEKEVGREIERERERERDTIMSFGKNAHWGFKGIKR